ncbi:vitelline envelope sperm lysin receptor-like [Liolophura sinensis]|uniref:vitelline envelope sperm lysin receptor-like n=1 Tax=Liolophura sinensis TaxID=3198878 RepID=UPI00315838A0
MLDLPKLYLRADVPAYAKAKCQNGDKTFTSTNAVEFELFGAFDRMYNGSNCQYYKKDGSNTFTVDVEIGWGELGSHVINNKDVKTISCAYDDHGRALSATETIAEWFLNPKEMQTLLGIASKAVFDLQVVDVLGRPVGPDHISIGRKIRLKATDSSNELQAFRALSCEAKNENSTYAILRAGCGDGLVFNKRVGFETTGAEVLSPYFEAFRLRGSANIQFQCTFTACDGSCDGHLHYSSAYIALYIDVLTVLDFFPQIKDDKD